MKKQWSYTGVLNCGLACWLVMDASTWQPNPWVVWLLEHKGLKQGINYTYVRVIWVTSHPTESLTNIGEFQCI